MRGRTTSGESKRSRVKPLPHMGPVFLFDMGIVIFFIGAASGKLNRPDPLGQIAKQVIV